MTPARRAAIFRRLAREIPAPATELRHRTPFQLMVAVILSAQATDVSVNKATKTLFPIASTPEALIALGEHELKRHIRHIGLANTKARNIIRTCQLLIERHGGEVPQERAALEALPGIGRKSAGIILNVAFGEATIAVDTHVFRLANRSGLAPGKTPRAVEEALLATTPARYRRHAHHWLILHGRHVCKARRPECWRCIIADLCLYPDKTPAP